MVNTIENVVKIDVTFTGEELHRLYIALSCRIEALKDLGLDPSAEVALKERVVLASLTLEYRQRPKLPGEQKGEDNGN